MMKVFIFSSIYFPYKAGTAVNVRQLAHRLVEKNLEVTVITCNTHKLLDQEIDQGVRVIRLKSWNPRVLNYSYPIPTPLSVINCWRLLRKSKPDIISIQTRFYLTSLIGFIFGKVYKMPVILVEHGGGPVISENKLINLCSKTIDLSLGWLLCRYSSLVVGLSESSRSFLKKMGARNITIIPFGVDGDFWRVETRDDNTKIVFTGRLVYAKGVQDLLQAISLIDQDINLDIIGDGPYRDRLEDLVKNLNIEHKVSFLGELDQKGIKEVFNNSTIFVNPSYSEGLPTSVLEAGAANLALVVTDVGGTREIIPEKHHQFLFKPGDVKTLTNALFMLINDDTRKRSFSIDTRRFINEKYSWSIVTDLYLKAFNLCLEKKNKTILR
jgi:glycosyltransferase involved in cell wall biosynthesis